jgi:uncharacterized membrane protein
MAAMVASHLAREILAHPHPMWLRVFGSVAAPLFIALAGELTAQTRLTKSRSLRHYLHRGGEILLLAAFVDLAIWQIYPFVGFDVLYLMGLAVPLAALFSRAPFALQAAVMAGVVLFSELLRGAFGYPEGVLIFALSHAPREVVAAWPRIVQQWLISGWFPLFPWVAFAWLGVWVFQWRTEAGRSSGGLESGRFSSRMLCAGIVLALLGIGIGSVFPPAFFVRDGYTELFYPPSLAYLITAAGAVLALFALAGVPALRENRPLRRLGRHPLLMYVLHLAILRWALRPYLRDVPLPAYLAVYAGLVLTLLAVAFAAELVEGGWRRRRARAARKAGAALEGTRTPVEESGAGLSCSGHALHGLRNAPPDRTSGSRT